MKQEDINNIVSKNTPDWRRRQIQSEGDNLELQAKYHDICKELELLSKAGKSLYDGFTDQMTQKQIDQFDQLYIKELKLFKII